MAEKLLKASWFERVAAPPHKFVVSEEIARKVDAQTIGERSPSFRGFLEAIRNGEPTPS
jgi:hypothetical protein